MTDEQVKEITARAEMEYEMLKDRVHDLYDKNVDLQQRINKAIEYIKNNSHKVEWGDTESQDEESIDINDDTTETEFIEQLLKILGGIYD